MNWGGCVCVYEEKNGLANKVTVRSSMTRLGRGGRAFEDIRKAEEDDDVDANDVVNGVDWNGWQLSCYNYYYFYYNYWHLSPGRWWWSRPTVSGREGSSTWRSSPGDGVGVDDSGIDVDGDGGDDGDDDDDDGGGDVDDEIELKTAMFVEDGIPFVYI